MAVKKYTREEFIRSLIVVIVSLVVTIFIISSMIRSTKKDVINSVENSARYYSKQIIGDLKNKFERKKRVNFRLAKKVLTQKNLDEVKIKLNQMNGAYNDIKELEKDNKDKKKKNKRIKMSLLPQLEKNLKSAESNNQDEIQKKKKEYISAKEVYEKDLENYKIKNDKLLNTQEELNNLFIKIRKSSASEKKQLKKEKSKLEKQQEKVETIARKAKRKKNKSLNKKTQLETEINELENQVKNINKKIKKYNIETENNEKDIKSNIKKIEKIKKKIPDYESKYKNSVEKKKNKIFVLGLGLPDKSLGKIKLKTLSKEDEENILSKGRTEYMKSIGLSKAEIDKINKSIDKTLSNIVSLSIESIAIWKRDENGEITNEYHTISRLSKKNLYGLRPGSALEEGNVKSYFKIKIENSWIENKYDKVQEFYIEDHKTTLQNKRRKNLHAIEKFKLKDQQYLIDLQYSKRSIVDNRITRNIQKIIVIAMVLYMFFIFIYSLVFDRSLLMHVIVLSVLVYTIYPLTWIFSNTFNARNSLGGTNLNPIPKESTLDNYKRALLNIARVKDEGIVLENNRLYISKEIIKTGKDVKDPISERSIITIYNVFDENKLNLWEKKELTLREDVQEEVVSYRGEEKKILKHRYYLEFNNPPEGDKASKIYNIEYYTYQNSYFLSGLFNSIAVSVSTAFLGMLLSTTAAYSFSRFKFPGRDAFMMSFLITQMFPGTMTMIPLYVIFSSLGLIDTFKGLILASSIGALPFNIWNLKGFFDTIPKDLEEAALIDGCSASQTFYIIVLPLSLPALAISALFSFMGAWNDFIMAATFLNNEAKYTIMVVIRMLQSSNDVDLPMFATMSVMASIPVVALFMAVQKYLVGGLTAGGVKG